MRAREVPTVPYDRLALALERDLVAVQVECEALERVVRNGGVAELEQAGYALAAAWLIAESSAMRLLAVRPGIDACRRFARGAITACSAIVTARFGEALAETSKRTAQTPRPSGLGNLRALLAQLAARVDVRDVDARPSPAEVRQGTHARRKATAALGAWGA
jgi:hypothetical protein